MGSVWGQLFRINSTKYQGVIFTIILQYIFLLDDVT